jgi:hypothetical protein
VLKRSQPRHHRNDGITQGLREPARSPQRLREKIGRLDHGLDHRAALGAVGLQQRPVGVTTNDEVELPGQIPDVVEPGVHALSAEWTVNVRGVAGDEDASDTEPRHLAVMRVEIAAPVQRARLQLARATFSQHGLHELERWSVAFGTLDRGDDASPCGTHRKNRDRARFAGAQLQLITRRRVVGLDVGQHVRRFVLRPLERQAEQMPNSAVGPVAADHEGGADLKSLASAIEHRRHAVAILDGGHERRLVFDRSAPRAEHRGQQPLRHVLGHHGDERIWTLLRLEPHAGERPSVGDDRDRRHTIGRLEKRIDDACHVEDLECPGKDGERFGMLGLGGAHLDEPPSQASARAFVRQEQADGSRADDQDISLDRGAQPLVHAGSLQRSRRSRFCGVGATKEVLAMTTPL